MSIFFKEKTGNRYIMDIRFGIEDLICEYLTKVESIFAQPYGANRWLSLNEN